MLHGRLVALFMTTFACLACAKADTPPTMDVISAWWKSKSNEKVSFYGKPIEVRLRSKEVAYLVDAAFDRGRNSMFRAVLVRPRLQEVREVDEAVATEIGVYDLDRNGVSEVVAQMVGSGGGTWQGVKVIVQFDDWTPVVLYESEFAQSCEATMWGPDCYSRDVSWKFVDIDGDGTMDLLENVTIREASTEGRTTTTKETHKVLFKKGDTFIE